MYIEENPFCLVANMLDCDIKVSEFELQSDYYVCYYGCYHIMVVTFVLMPLGKGTSPPPLSPQLRVKSYHYYSSTRMGLASNNCKCHLTKKANQYIYIYI